MKDYIKSILTNDERLDGRKLLDCRDVVITNDVSEKAEGSARVKFGETEVLAGVKMDIGTPYRDSADKGTFMVTAELLPMANPDFSTGPPSIQSIELARVIDRGIREANVIDLKKLCVEEGEAVWSVFVDIYVINDAGNILDAAALAVVSALRNAFIPKLDKDNRVMHGELSKKKLPIFEDRVPLTCTVHKIGDKLFVDPLLREEHETEARLSIGMDDSGNINSMQKGEKGFFTLEEIDKAVDIVKDSTKKLRKNL